MILEIAILDVKPKQEKYFEAAFEKAKNIISNFNGYIAHQLSSTLGMNYYLLKL